MKFELGMELLACGWRNLRLECAGDRHETDMLSRLTDVLGDFSDAVFHLLDGAAETKWVVEHEPGETRIHFLRDDANVRIRVYSYEKTFAKGSLEDGRLVFECETLLLRLKSQYLNLADCLLKEYGAAEYEYCTKYPFPMERYHAIRTGHSQPR